VHGDVNWKSVCKTLRGMVVPGQYRTINLSRSKLDAQRARTTLSARCHDIFGKGNYSTKKLGPSTYRVTRLG
jgi:hypothetical protein